MRWIDILMTSALMAAPGFAQVPPRAADLEAYSGLHLAAALGDAME
jgi:hypothetical protein